jgi:hypothetical protein
MLPSPSLGPPLLSASWSPPLPCGMGLPVWAGAVAGGAGGVLAGGAGGAACAGVEWAWLCAAPAGFGAAGCVAWPADEPHAASVTASAAAGRASSIRRCRLSSFSRVSDLIIAFSICSWTRPGPGAGGTLTIPPCNRRCPAGGICASARAPRPAPQQARTGGCLLPRSRAAGGLAPNPAGCPEPLAEMSVCRDGERTPGAMFRDHAGRTRLSSLLVRVAAVARGGQRLDIAVAIARAAVVVGVLVTAVALRDGIGWRGRRSGRRRRRRRWR